MSNIDPSLPVSDISQSNCNRELKPGFFKHTFIKTSLGNVHSLLKLNLPSRAETTTSSPVSHFLRSNKSWDCDESHSTTKSPEEPFFVFCNHVKKKKKKHSEGINLLNHGKTSQTQKQETMSLFLLLVDQPANQWVASKSIVHFYFLRGC